MLNWEYKKFDIKIPEMVYEKLDLFMRLHGNTSIPETVMWTIGLGIHYFSVSTISKEQWNKYMKCRLSTDDVLEIINEIDSIQTKDFTKHIRAYGEVVTLGQADTVAKGLNINRSRIVSILILLTLEEYERFILTLSEEEQKKYERRRKYGAAFKVSINSNTLEYKIELTQGLEKYIEDEENQFS